MVVDTDLAGFVFKWRPEIPAQFMSGWTRRRFRGRWPARQYDRPRWEIAPRWIGSRSVGPASGIRSGNPAAFSAFQLEIAKLRKLSLLREGGACQQQGRDKRSLPVAMHVRESRLNRITGSWACPQGRNNEIFSGD